MFLKSSDILRRERIAVEQEFDRVVLKVGNAELKMPYDTALQLSAWLRSRGREAKRFAGDTSRKMTVLGTLTDASR